MIFHFVIFFLEKLGTSSQEKSAMVSIIVTLLFWSKDFSWMYWDINCFVSNFGVMISYFFFLE